MIDNTKTVESSNCPGKLKYFKTFLLSNKKDQGNAIVFPGPSNHIIMKRAGPLPPAVLYIKDGRQGEMSQKN